MPIIQDQMSGQVFIDQLVLKTKYPSPVATLTRGIGQFLHSQLFDLQLVNKQWVGNTI
jgi:hypothetical protein